MTMFDKVVATDLAALGVDSRQRMGSLLAMMPKPAPFAVEQQVDPAWNRANRLAGMVAGVTAIACGAAVAILPSRPMFISHWNPEVVPSITTNVWLLAFIAVVTVASTFLVAHCIALHRSPELLRRARGVGDLVFGGAMIAWVVTWFVVAWRLNHTPELLFNGRMVMVWNSNAWDERFDPTLVIAGGLACALVARSVAVTLANRVSDRWRGAPITVLLKITAISLLISVFGLCMFDSNLVGQWGWAAMTVAQRHTAGWQHWEIVHTMNTVVRLYQAPLSDTQWATLEVIATMTILAAIFALACMRERHMKRATRWLVALEHVAIVPLATVCVVVALLGLGWSETDNGVGYPPLPATVALVTILVSSTLRRRRNQLAPAVPAPEVSSAASGASP